jgi:tetratricopeptide (TPR) repeat protein
MPYFGGTSLARVLETLWRVERTPHSGRSLVRSLRDASTAGDGPLTWRSSFGSGSFPAPPPVGAPAAGPAGAAAPAGGGASPLKLLSRGSFVEAAAWIIARLAEGLHHAHQRGVLHRDIKPSNILLTAEGQPMLLDFNLAQTAADTAQAALGGTVAYMAPEHLQALAAPDANPAGSVDHRADIYSLGLVFFEMLTGHGPFTQAGSKSAFPSALQAMADQRGRSVPSARRYRPDIPWSLESVLRKCLAPRPEDRYQDAEQLAEDLRRFLEHRPLKYASELSRREVLAKWLRRNPRLTAAGPVAAFAAAVVIALGSVLAVVHDHWQDAQAEQRLRQFDERAAAALCLLNTQLVRAGPGTRLTLQEHVRRGAREGEAALAVYGVLTNPHWQDDPLWKRLDADQRRRAAGDVRELLLELAYARYHLARQEFQVVPPVVLDDALALLAHAEALPGLEPCAALFDQRAAYLDELARHHGRDTAAAAEAARRQAAATPLTTARDHYLLALAKVGRHRLPEAVALLRRALQLDPRHYWARFRLGLCYQELGQFDLAASTFAECVALWPEFAWAYLNRGIALHHLHRYAEAIEDYDQALRWDPGLAPAYLNRGLAYQRQSDSQSGPNRDRALRQALADLERAEALGLSDAALPACRGSLLEALGRPAEADEAFARAVRLAPDDVSLRLMRGFAVSRRAPQQALADFEEVLRRQPESLEALYGKGAVLTDPLGRVEEAWACFEEALRIHPDFVPALRGRAILAARQGEFLRAGADVRRCLELEPTGINYYTAACVFALWSRVDPAAGPVAVRHLDAALHRGYGADRFVSDDDLAPLWRQPGYWELFHRWGSAGEGPAE